MAKTKEELSKELKREREKIKQMSQHCDDIDNANCLAARYLQVVRATINAVGGTMTPLDFDRALDILRQDRHLEGF